MNESLVNVCDHYIARCRKVLAEKDMAGARILRTEATIRFHDIIPRWSAGLMASITHFYLDDVENILGKLTAFKEHLDKLDDHISIPLHTACLTPAMRRVGLLNSFEQTIDWIHNSYVASVADKNDALIKIDELRSLAMMSAPSQDKWDQLKEMIDWVKEKNAEIAKHMLPLFAEVFD